MWLWRERLLCMTEICLNLGLRIKKSRNHLRSKKNEQLTKDYLLPDAEQIK